MAGQRFGRLVVIQPEGRTSYRQTMWACRCDCGNTKIVRGIALRNGATRSCGCWNAERRTTHGQSYEPTYRRWVSMKNRCNDKRRPAHGGRGITYDPSWNDYSKFYADVGPCPTGMVLDRIDNDGNYEPGNVRWATLSESNKNKRYAKGERVANNKLTADQVRAIRADQRPQKTISQDYGVNPSTISLVKSRKNWSHVA
jgi:hypothetical protein